MKNKKGFVHIVMIPVVILIAIVGYLLFLNFNVGKGCGGFTRKPNYCLPGLSCQDSGLLINGEIVHIADAGGSCQWPWTKLEPEGISVSSSEVQDVSDWKTYTSERLGFTIEYPSNSILSESEVSTERLASILYCDDLAFEACSETSFVGQHINIQLYNFSRESEEVPECLEDTKEVVESNGITWNTYSGQITEKDCPDEFSWGHYEQSAYAKIGEEQYVELSSYFLPKGGIIKIEQLEIFDQILSAFKFCTPRPVCLDTEPRCMIPETSDMCPPSN